MDRSRRISVHDLADGDDDDGEARAASTRPAAAGSNRPPLPNRDDATSPILAENGLPPEEEDIRSRWEALFAADGATVDGWGRLLLLWGMGPLTAALPDPDDGTEVERG